MQGQPRTPLRLFYVEQVAVDTVENVGGGSNSLPLFPASLPCVVQFRGATNVPVAIKGLYNFEGLTADDLGSSPDNETQINKLVRSDREACMPLCGSHVGN